MCPEKIHTSFNRQRGFLMPVALFIIVIMGIYALVLWRTTSQSNLSAVQEVITVQAFYAAESGAQRGMAELFFPDASSRQDIDDRCVNMNISMNFSVTGLNNCSAIVTCELNTITTPVIRSFYSVDSTGSCGSGNISAMRTLEVQATIEQEGI